jgi:hypothetical protein
MGQHSKPAKPKAPKTSRRRFAVARVIATRGTVAQFARDLSNVTGHEVTWARVNAWRIRNSIPKEMVFPVHRLTRVSLSKLLK